MNRYHFRHDIIGVAIEEVFPVQLWSCKIQLSFVSQQRCTLLCYTLWENFHYYHNKKFSTAHRLISVSVAQLHFRFYFYFIFTFLFLPFLFRFSFHLFLFFFFNFLWFFFPTSFPEWCLHRELKPYREEHWDQRKIARFFEGPLLRWVSSFSSLSQYCGFQPVFPLASVSVV